ncbi:MAG: TetR family transcriptional regulator [Mycobacterium sp.]
MAVQTRATETRKRIVDAAVELFSDRGYSETTLNDITELADVTTGAFYYHFKSKEDLAGEVSAQGWPKAWKVVSECMGAPTPGLEKVITMTFAVSALLKRDKSVWISNHLNQSLGLLSEEGRKTFEIRAQSFITGIAEAVRGTDIRTDVPPEDIGNEVWMMLHGCHLLSDAFGDSVVERLASSWRILLRSIVPDDSQAYFGQFVVRTARENS